MKFADGNFDFWTALHPHGRCTIFRVREDTTPAKRAQEKGIKGYYYLEPSNEHEIAVWLETHLVYPVQEENL